MGQWSSGYEARKSAHKSDGIIGELFPLFLFFIFRVPVGHIRLKFNAPAYLSYGA
jgi:hypothetical protein